MLLMDQGLDPNGGEKNGFTPLMLVALRGNVEMLELLLALRAHVPAVDKDGQHTPALARPPRDPYSPPPSLPSFPPRLSSVLTL